MNSVADTLVEVSGLGKAYKVYRRPYDRFLEWVTPWMGERHEKRWVFRDVNFRVFRGQTFGIVGVNGAGKSTLLRILAGIMPPTEGSIIVHGSVSAILELGVGFHPELTGRQNILASAALLGFDSRERSRLLNDIVEFAELQDFIDQPLRTYSTGMQMRLAFGLATAKRPDLLIIDEALSVGDGYFQLKSFDRIRAFRKQGTAIVFVSHDRQAIQSLCDQVMLLNQGGIERQGDPESVMDYYNALLTRQKDLYVRQVASKMRATKTMSGNGWVRTTDAALLDERGRRIVVAKTGDVVYLLIKAQVLHALPRLVFGYSIRNQYGFTLFGTNTAHTQQVIYDLAAGDEVCCKVKIVLNLGPGIYSIQTAFVDSDTHLTGNYEWMDRALEFEVVNVHHHHFAGNVWLVGDVSVNHSRARRAG